MRKLLFFILCFATKVYGQNPVSYNCPVAIYTNPTLYHISNALVQNDKIVVAVAHSGVDKFPGYPDPASKFYKLDLAKDDGTIIPIEAQSVSDLVSMMRVTPQGNVSMVYKKPTGIQYGFNGHYREFNGTSSTANESMFSNANIGINTHYAFGSNNTVGVSFSAAGYFLVYHKRVTSGNWLAAQMTNTDNQYWNFRAERDNANALHILAKWSNNNTNRLDYLTVTPTDTVRFLGSVATGIKDVYETQIRQNQLKTLFGIGNELRIVTLNTGNATPLSNVLVISNVPDLRGGRFGYRADGRLVVAYQTPTIVRVLQETVAGTGSFTEIFAQNVATINPMVPSLVTKAGKLHVVFGNANTVFAYDLDAGSLTASIALNIAACAGQSNGSATATATAGVSPYAYKWSNNQTVATATNLAAGTYTVTITGSNGCTATATLTLAAAQVPSATIASTPACTGQSNGLATVTATGGTTPYTYKWSNNQTMATATNLATGIYTVTVTGNNSCSVTSTATINAAPASKALFTISGSAPSFTFTNSSTNANTYLWNFGNGNTSTQTNAAQTYTKSGIYQVCLIATGACGKDTVCQTVTIAPAGWTQQPCNTGIVHSVAILDKVVTSIGGKPLEKGNLIGFFFADGTGKDVCSNFGVWEGNTLALDICGDNPATTNVKEGFAPGENFVVKVWKDTVEYNVIACYVPKDALGLNNPSHAGSFAPNGLSYIECLKTPAPPGTDLDCSAPIPIVCGETKTGNSVNGVIGANTYNCFPNLVDGAEVVYRFVNPTTQNVLITLTGLQRDLELLLLDACDRNKCAAYSDRTGTSPEAVFMPQLAAGTYYIVVEGYLGAASAYSLRVQCDNSITNGALNCSSATPIACGQTINANTNTGSNTVIRYNCSPAYTSGKERIYSFVSTTNKVVQARLSGLGADLDLFVIDPCNPNSCLRASNKSGLEEESAIFTAVANKAYYLIVDGYFGAEGAFSLTTTCYDPCTDPNNCPYEIGGPGGQRCITAPILKCNQPVTGNNGTGQAIAGFYACPGSYTNGRELVYKFINDATQDVTIILSGLSANLDLYLLNGCSIFNCLVSSHKSGASDEGVVVQALPVGEYFIVVDGYNNAISGFSLTVTCSKSTLTCQKIDLVAGTNFISSNVVPIDPTIETMFPPSAQSPIISVENQANISYSPSAQSSSTGFGDWDFKKAYRIKALKATSFEVCGERADPDTPIPYIAQTPQGIPVNNWIGYLKEQPIFVKDSFTPTLTPKIFRVWNMLTNAMGVLTPQSYLVTVQSGVNFEMKPGRGYILNASADGQYSYGFWSDITDDRSNGFQLQAPYVPNGCQYFTTLRQSTLKTATVILPKSVLEMALLESGDEIGFFDTNGALYGSGVLDSKSIAFVVAGDDPNTHERKEGFNGAEGFIIKYWKKKTGIVHEAKIDFENRTSVFESDAIYVATRFEWKESAAQNNQNRAFEWIVFPNPTDQDLLIDVWQPDMGHTRLDIFTVEGKWSQTLQSGHVDSGHTRLKVDVGHLAPGIYLLKMTATSGVYVKKITIL